MQFKEKKLRTRRVCRYTRYANSLNIKPEAAASFDGVEGGEGREMRDEERREDVRFIGRTPVTMVERGTG
jgi:hypothetical protein